MCWKRSREEQNTTKRRTGKLTSLLTGRGRTMFSNRTVASSLKGAPVPPRGCVWNRPQTEELTPDIEPPLVRMPRNSLPEEDDEPANPWRSCLTMLVKESSRMKESSPGKGSSPVMGSSPRSISIRNKVSERTKYFRNRRQR